MKRWQTQSTVVEEYSNDYYLPSQQPDIAQQRR